ncbi:hypothetical protein GDO81_010789 [Engystomops pustulosus]|uniref:Uncharacterized protein n=1 Tax=Engystomops pustulosus TaxID=76066 RepID=A0AAV7C3K6_ENGPU|nr:hypothetical protein GDO81_010789 [Engystomops pustulosus]
MSSQPNPCVYKRDDHPYVNLSIHWNGGNVQRVPSLIRTGTKATLICGNLKKFKGPKGNLPIRNYPVLVVPIPEYIIDIDILKGITLHLKEGKFAFGVRKTEN